jgi:Flp pilus assembly protein TadD
MAPVLLAALAATLQGYVFREADGGPPRRPMTVELVRDGKVAHRETTEANGAFQFDKVREGRYGIRVRYPTFTVVEDVVDVSAAGPNFAAVMIPKRRAGTGQQFGTVSYAQLSARSDRDHQKRLREAARLTQNREWAAAARYYEQALEKHPSADVFDAVAVLYLQLGRKEEAFQAWEKSIAQDPNYLLSYSHLAAMYFEDRRWKDLLDVANRALLADPKWMTGHLYLGQALVGLNQYETAARSARTAVELVRGRAAGPHLLLAQILWRLQDCRGAREHLDRYVQLNTSAQALPELQKSRELLNGCP